MSLKLTSRINLGRRAELSILDRLTTSAVALTLSKEFFVLKRNARVSMVLRVPFHSFAVRFTFIFSEGFFAYL